MVTSSVRPHPKSAATLLLVLLILAGCTLLPADRARNSGGQGEEPTPTPIPTPITISKPTYTVARGEVTKRLILGGRILPVTEKDLFFRTSGHVRNVFVQSGEMVKAGQVLADLEMANVERDLAGSQLELERAQARLKTAETDLQQNIKRAQANLDIALFLVPALALFALTLVLLRVLPLIMRAIVRLISRTRSAGLLLAARHLARNPGSYAAPLLLLVLTLSLSAYTASLAQTLDNHLYDQSYYQIGADLRVDELGASGGPADVAAYLALGGKVKAGEEEPRWLFLPVAEHLKVPGIEAAGRVGRYPATAQMSSRTVDGTFLGISRLSANSISSRPGIPRTGRCLSATWTITSSISAARCPTAYG
jgi:hypothetical protein